MHVRYKKLKIEKRLLPGSGETDCRYILYIPAKNVVLFAQIKLKIHYYIFDDDVSCIFSVTMYCKDKNKLMLLIIKILIYTPKIKMVS